MVQEGFPEEVAFRLRSGEGRGKSHARWGGSGGAAVEVARTSWRE